MADPSTPPRRRPDDRILVVVEHDPRWVAAFAAERQRLAAALPEALSIEHVGSTSIPGMPAKPTIDILVVVRSMDHVLDRRRQLAELGYDHKPGAFPDPQHAFFRRVVGGRRTHHLHALEEASPEPARYRLFRQYLLAHPDAAARYRHVKLALAERHRLDRQAYVEEKSRFVDGLMAEAEAWGARRS